MKKYSAVMLLIFVMKSIHAQPLSTEIYLSDISEKKGVLVFSTPVNITHHEGYDNQPEFSPDGKKILYVSMPDTLQSDLFEYTIADSTTKQLTHSEESEFSPRFAPEEKKITAVRVNKAKAQRLSSYPDSFDEGEELLPGMDSIGYYLWMNDSLLALVNLNNGLELALFELYSNQFIVPEKNIGRYILKVPGEDAVMFTRKSGSSVQLYKYSVSGDRTFPFIKGMDDVEDYAFTPDGALLGSKNGKLFMIRPGKENEWKMIADFSKSCGPFYRMTISPDGKRIALVAYTGKKP